MTLNCSQRIFFLTWSIETTESCNIMNLIVNQFKIYLWKVSMFLHNVFQQLKVVGSCFSRLQCHALPCWKTLAFILSMLPSNFQIWYCLHHVLGEQCQVVLQQRSIALWVREATTMCKVWLTVGSIAWWGRCEGR